MSNTIVWDHFLSEWKKKAYLLQMVYRGMRHSGTCPHSHKERISAVKDTLFTEKELWKMDYAQRDMWWNHLITKTWTVSLQTDKLWKIRKHRYQKTVVLPLSLAATRSPLFVRSKFSQTPVHCELVYIKNLWYFFDPHAFSIHSSNIKWHSLTSKLNLISLCPCLSMCSHSMHMQLCTLVCLRLSLSKKL